MSISEATLRRAFETAFAEARWGVMEKHGGPFGAAIVRGDTVIAVGHSTVQRDADPTRHAEMNAISNAGKFLGDPHLKDCILVTSSEPCLMCLAAAQWAHIAEAHYALPMSVAAQYGFNDGIFFDDLKKPAGERLISVTAEGMDFYDEAEEIFRTWQAKNGVPY